MARLCVCVCHESVLYGNGWTDRAGFWRESFLRPILHCVAPVKLQLFMKLSQTVNENFATTRLSLQRVVNLAGQWWTLFVTNWTVFGRTDNTDDGRRSTDELGHAVFSQ